MELNPIIREILIKRGITGEEALAEFLSDKPQKTYDPFLLHDMEAGVDLILSAVENGDKICIYGDYDADGVTSIAVLRDVLKALGADVSYYIPSRFDEGYGLNKEALDKIKAAGTDLVVSVDCGCTSVNEVRHAKEIGLDILITDHHALKDEIPDCLLIDPKHPDCPYPFKELAGVGVTFKLCQALVETAGLPKQILTKNLDMVGIGTIGDLVPLLDENRMLAKYGLRTVNLAGRPGLKALIEKVGLNPGEVTSRNVSYVIVPHINAAGRMDDATLAARLMQADTEAKASEMAERLIECNKRRRAVQDELTDRSDELAGLAVERGDKFFLLNLEDAHEGVIGIVAGRLKERYNLPTLIITAVGNGEYKGTGRSPDGVDLFEIMNKHNELFLRFGGHAVACGFTIKEENIEVLRAALKKETEELLELRPDAFVKKIVPEVIASGKDVDFGFLSQQNMLEPFGKNNPKPLIGVYLTNVGWSRMGAEGQYIRISGRMDDGRELRCVDFKKGDLHAGILEGAGCISGIPGSGSQDKLLAVGTLDKQVWNGNEYIQLTIETIEWVK